jgi:UDP-N-acetylglucosamine 3-dehydrogenase
MSGAKDLRVGVVGVGVMGFNHARAVKALDGVSLAGVLDADAERAGKVSADLGCRRFVSVAEMADAGLDCAIVAAPNALHREVGCALLEAGCHVLVEKPIAPSVADAKALIDAARARDRVLMVGHIERFNPAVKAAKKACAGEKIISITITRVGPFPPRMSQIGVVIDLGVHDIDIIRMIAGSEITDVQAMMSSTHAQREDTALMQFCTATNIIAQVNTNWTTPYKLRTLQIATEGKFIAADLMTRQVVEYLDYKEDGSFRSRPLFVPMADPLRDELSGFFAAVRKGGPAPITGEDGLANLEVALKCLEVGSRPVNGSSQ